MKLIFLAAALMPLMSSGAIAQYKAYGMGAGSCAAWQADPAHISAGNHYITGLWTGLNMFNPASHKMVGSKTDAVGIIGEVKLYCASHPSDALADAISETYVMMDKREYNWK